MNSELLQKYAHLIVKMGINIQKNQILVITTPIECAEIARVVAEIAYKEGARDVVMNWIDEKFLKIRYKNAPEEIFEEYPDWKKEFFVSYVRKGAAFLSISAEDPEIMKDVKPEIIAKASKTTRTAIKEYYDKLMSNKNQWCVISVPTKAWAKKIFPEALTEEAAVDKLWEAIFKVVRASEENPVKAWELHKANLKKSLEFLNNNKFKYLIYKNSIGTDLKIQLPEKHQWLGGAEYTTEGVEFVANIPTEEVFTLPIKDRVDGKVVSSRPLIYNGNLIDNFTLTFKAGKIVDFTAEKGYEVLKSIIETDEGSCYLGEVALVPYNSPISNSNILFYNTLFDENAACHLAIGKAYSVCIKDSENLSEEQLEKLGVNESLVHEDFMIGTEDLNIIGVTEDGKEITIFNNGNFAY